MSVETTSFKFVNTSWMQNGQAVWIQVTPEVPLKKPRPNPPLYVRAHIQYLNPKRTMANLIYMEKDKGPEQVDVKYLIKAQYDYDKFPDGWSDMVQMNMINHPELLNNIKLRFEKQLYFTYVDQALIACQPDYEDITSIRFMNEYKLLIMNKQPPQLKDTQPHIFSTIFLAYQKIQTDQANQQIMISGQSGSGKTANVKALVRMFGKLKDESFPDFEDKLQAATHFIFDLISAPNKYNPESTKAGFNYKFQVNSQSKKVLGVLFQPFYIEVSLLQNQIKGKESFKFFKEELKVKDLQTVGFNDDEISKIKEAKQIILQLAEDKYSGNLLPENNEMNRLKLMECMYKTLCYWVFEKCSALLAPKTTKNLYTINVLESSGLELEILDNFEGLMANYYYEKIDQFFVEDMFKSMIQDFKEERMEYLSKSIQFHDNEEVLDLFQKKLLVQMQKPTDQEIEQSISNSVEIKQNQFTIKHSQGEITYTLDNFAMKNQNKQFDVSSFFPNLKNSTDYKTEAALKIKKKLFSNQSIYVKCIRVNPVKGKFVDSYVLNQICKINVDDLIKLNKNSFPIRQSYADYYNKYHQLDPFNKRFKLERHLNMGTDLKLLVKEMHRRINPGYDQKSIIFGKNMLYMKKDTGYKMDSLKSQWDKKLDDYATKIQAHFKVLQFKRKMMKNLKRLSTIAKENPDMIGKLSNIPEGQEDQYIKEAAQGKLIQQDEVKMVQSKPLYATEEEISDNEAYCLLTDEQKQEYKRLKDERVLKNESQKMQQGEFGDDDYDSFCSTLLNAEQKKIYNQRLEAKREAKRKAEEAEIKISDEECFALLTEKQQKQYKQKKREKNQLRKNQILAGKFEFAEDEEGVAYSLLTEEQRQARQIKQEQMQQQNQKMQFAELEDLSDEECFAMLTEEQKEEYVERKKFDDTKNLAFSMLSKEQQEEIKNMRKETAQQGDQSKKLQAMEVYLSDPEAYSLLDQQQLEKYKQGKLEGKKNVALNLLTQKQLKQRRKLKIEKARQKGAKVKFAEDHVSDDDSYAQLSEEQKQNYKQQKKQKNEVKKEMNELQFGYEGIVSDPESIKLMTENQKEQWLKAKKDEDLLRDDVKSKGVLNISDDECFCALNEEQRDQYVEKKLAGEQNVAENLLTDEQKDKLIEDKMETQKLLDEMDASDRQDLLTSKGFNMLDEDQKKERIKMKDDKKFTDSVAYSQLTVMQREQRKKKDQTKEKLKNIINPILFADELDDNESVAFALLSENQQDEIYKKEQNYNDSLAYNMLNDKKKEERQIEQIELDDRELRQVKTLEDKKALLAAKIEQYEMDKAQYGNFSDYEAFCVLTQEQKDEYKEKKEKGEEQHIAYGLMDKEQRKKLHKRKLRKKRDKKRRVKDKYKYEGDISDLDSFFLLNENQKKEYLAKKQEGYAKLSQEYKAQYGVDGNFSDEVALIMLNEEQKKQYSEQKQKKGMLQKQIAKQGFYVEFDDNCEDATVFTIDEHENHNKQINQLEKQLEEEENRVQEELEQQKEKKKKEQKQENRVKRTTLFKQEGIDIDSIKSDDFKTRGIDIWPIEASLYMKKIEEDEAKKPSIVDKLLENPNEKPYNIPPQSLDKRLLDSSCVNQLIHEIPQFSEYDPAFLQRVKQSQFLVFCDKKIIRNKQYSKKEAIAKIMKVQTDILQEPLCIDFRSEKSKQMFRSLLKVGLLKRSRFTPLQHAMKIIYAILGPQSFLEAPEPDSRYIRKTKETYEDLQEKDKFKLEELNFDKDSDEDKKKKQQPVPDRSINEFDLNKSLEERIQVLYQSPNAQFRLELYLQVFKELGQNKHKDQIFALLNFLIVLTYIAAPTDDSVFPFLNFVLDNCETNKLYKEEAVNQSARILFRNLAYMAQAVMLAKKEKDITQLFPKQVDPKNLSSLFESENQLNNKTKEFFSKCRILKGLKDPMSLRLFKIQIGLSGVSDVQYYQLQQFLPRKYLPSDDEFQLMDQNKQVVTKIYLFSETPIYVQIGHNWLVYEVKNACCRHMNKEIFSQFYCLQIIQTDNGKVVKEFELNDQDKYLDFLNKYEQEDNVQKKKYKMKKSFQIYLKIRIYYRLFKTDKDSVNLFYFQSRYEVLRNKYPIKPSDALLLAALSIYSKEGRYSNQNQNTTKQTIEKTLDQLVSSKLLDGTFQEIRMRYHNEYLPIYNFKDWANYISEEYQDLQFNSKQEARWEYLSILRYYDLFLSIQFQASYFTVNKDSKGVMRKTQPKDVILALRPLHVVVTDYPALKTQQLIHYFDINSWGKSESGNNYFFIRGEDGSVTIFEFEDRTSADYTINAYINWSLGKPVDSHLCSEFNDILSFLVESNTDLGE